MADIRTYLQELEARLAPSLDTHALRERLTEAENHLRDRAQEFEEVGLPPHEAEARAIAAFGEPEEYVEDVPPRILPLEKPVRETRPGPSRDLALQLAWSAVGLGLVSMLVSDKSVWIAGGAAVAFIGFGALFGRTTSTLRMAGLALVAALAAFPVLLSFYEPLPYNDAFEKERLGVRLHGVPSQADFAYYSALTDLAHFERAWAAYHTNGVERRPREELYGAPSGFVGPSADLPDGSGEWPGGYYYNYGRGDGLSEYASATEAARMWKQNGGPVHARLAAAVAKAKPIVPQLDEYERDCRFGLVAGAGGVAFLALMVGVQAIGLALRAAFAWLFGGLRRPERSSGLCGEPGRS